MKIALSAIETLIVEMASLLLSFLVFTPLDLFFGVKLDFAVLIVAVLFISVAAYFLKKVAGFSATIFLLTFLSLLFGVLTVLR